MIAKRKWMNDRLFKTLYPVQKDEDKEAFDKQIKRLENAKTFRTIALASYEASRRRRIVWRRVKKLIGFPALNVMANNFTTIDGLLELERKALRDAEFVARCRAV